MDIILWIDDERPAPKGFTHVAKTSQEAIDILASLPEDDVLYLVSFDHDLSMDPTDGHPKADDGEPHDDSRRVIYWMRENNVWPMEAHVHSMNPVGAKWLYDSLSENTDTWYVPYNPRNYS